MDDRIYGERRYIHRDTLGPLMIIPDEMRKCVVFLGIRLPSGEVRHVGTGFLAAKKIEEDLWTHYLVTARHVVDGIRDHALESVLVRLNLKSGTSIWAQTKLSDWWSSPDKTIDLAMTGFMPDSDNHDHLYYPLHSMATKEYLKEQQVGPGEEVFMTGLFGYHKGKERSIPIVRVGNIAAMPEERVKTQLGMMEAYLVESRSLRGLSGSPVFLHLGIVRQLGGETMITGSTTGGHISLLGITHGHFKTEGLELDDAIQDTGFETRLNAGIAIVTPAWRIMDLINLPHVQQAEEEGIKKHKSKDLPEMDSALEPPFTKEDFENALKKASRKLGPDK